MIELNTDYKADECIQASHSTTFLFIYPFVILFLLSQDDPLKCEPDAFENQQKRDM